ncbi:UNVERIFIED_CONTAM: hypothetical protein FKN15_070366 [Acipenser sinensis]
MFVFSCHTSPVKVLKVRLKLVPKPLGCPHVPTSTIPRIKPPMDRTATIYRPTEENEDGDPRKPERGKGGQRKEAVRNVYNGK